MALRMSESGLGVEERRQDEECVSGVFDWFGELRRLSGWYEGKRRVIGCKKLNSFA